MNLTDWMRRASRRVGARRVALVLPLAAVIGVVGCNEKLDGSAGCPLTCVDQSAQIQTVDLDAIATATTVLGGLGLGTSPFMLVASRGDTLDTRLIVRFDTLPPVSAKSATDTSTGTSFQFADSVYLRLRIDSLGAALSVPATLSVYDVDTGSGDDTTVAVLAPLFTPSRLIATAQVPAGKLADSVAIRLPNSFLTSKAAAKARVRLGVQISASTSASVRVASTQTGYGPSIVLRNYPDTTHSPILLNPFSTTPTTNSSIAGSLADFSIVVRGTPPPAPGLLAVGGLPGKQAYLRFDVPAKIVDSSLVIRATLLLTQLPSQSPDPTDTMLVQPHLILAGPTVSDPAKAAQVLADTVMLPLSRLAATRTTPASSGVREIEIAPAFAFWAAQSDSTLPRAITLRSAQEDYSPQQALFYSPTASDPSLRPKLRISYTVRSHIGLP